MEELQFTVITDFDERIDKCISNQFSDLSRSYIQKLIKDGNVLVNNNSVKSNYKVKENDIIQVLLPEAESLDVKAEDIPLDILYEDSDVIVINKPKDMVVHPAAGHFEGTLVNALLFHCKDDLSGINGVLRPGIVHRIDKDTTGSVIVCKNDIAHNNLAAQLKEHSITRKYYAICYGRIVEDEGTVDAPIGRHPTERKKMAINHTNGKNAITHYRVLERFNNYTYIECVLETGRTHQIRVHMASINHPLLGDTVYAKNRKNPFISNGQVLHAGVLGFKHPTTGEYIEVRANLPLYFSDLLDTIRKKNL